MRVPAVLFGATLLAVGVFAPSVLNRPAPAPAGAIRMTHEGFQQKTVTITRGQTLEFYNDSGYLHVIGPGDDGRLTSESGTPQLGPHGAFISEVGDLYQTSPWNIPGTYHITCSLHPEMNITVIVTG